MAPPKTVKKADEQVQLGPVIRDGMAAHDFDLKHRRF